MEGQLTRIAEMAQGTVGHKDLCWLISEIERLRRLLRGDVFPRWRGGVMIPAEIADHLRDSLGVDEEQAVAAGKHIFRQLDFSPIWDQVEDLYRDLIRDEKEENANRLGAGRSTANGEFINFATKEDALAWISREPMDLWILFDRPSGRWIAVNRFPLLGECYDQQGIRHG